ncbi:MAG: hypothetical protein ABI091_27000 [Ferruginibacter sp.]
MVKSKGTSDSGYGIVKFIASLIKELGIPAFGVLFFTVVFIKVASDEQKKEFVDKFFLFKDVNNNPFPFSFVILALLLIVLLQHIFYNKIIKTQGKEIDRIAKEKSALQSRQTGKNLNSSKGK